MNRYPLDAQTVKTLDQFSYDTYSALSINMLKYNHDTSATIRLLSTIINTSREINEDLPYQISFNIQGLDFISIDRMNAFYWPTIKGFVIDENGDTNCLLGYSRYTDKTYQMKRISKQSDFIRHSLPIDSFFAGAAFPGAKQLVMLSPYIKEVMDLDIKSTQITIRQHSGFSVLSQDSAAPIKIIIYGVDIRGNVTSEEISIVADINYPTVTEWTRITGILATNTSVSVGIMFYPYIAGDLVLSKELIIDRQHLEPGICLLSVDRDKKQLVYNLLRENFAEYPLGYDILKTVPLQIPATHDILSYYIDEPNKLVYAIHGKKEVVAGPPVTESYIEHTFSCYPLIIPTTPNNTLDRDKTAYQAVSVEYEEDCINDEWNMWLFPTSKTNDVETCNISINGEIYVEGLLLDLIRHDIDTNRVTIPFSDIYTKCKTSALVEIETYGRERSYTAFTLDRTSLKPLYDKSLDTYLRRFKKEPAVAANWSVPTEISTKLSYKSGDSMGWGDGAYGGLTETLPPRPFGMGGLMDINYNDEYEIYKLSSAANVVVNGQKIVNIFNSFYADENNKYIITSDTITHIAGGDCSAEIECTPDPVAPPVPTANWYNLVDMRVWGGIGEGIPNGTNRSVMSFWGIDGSDEFYSWADIASPKEGYDFFSTYGYINNGTSAFWGKGNNIQFSDFSGFGVHNPAIPGGPYDPTKGWRPTKIRISWTPTNVPIKAWITNDGPGMMTDPDMVRTGGYAEIDLDYGAFDITNNIGVLDVLEFYSDTGAEFKITQLDAFGDDPASYWALMTPQLGV